VAVTEAVAAELRDGMRAQLEELRRRLADGAGRLGWKVGFNDPAMQRRLGLDGFIVGALDASRRLAPGGVCRLPAGVSAFVEAEVAVRIDRDLDRTGTSEGAWECVGALAPAIEVVDYARPASGVAAILSHSIFHSASIIGAECAPAEFADIGPQSPVLFKNGARERGPEAALRIADMGRLLARVGAILREHGEEVRAGDWVITGSWVSPAPVAPGDSVEVDFGPLGRVGARFDG
jgi:2-keto-4-pentenoate hydratase